MAAKLKKVPSVVLVLKFKGKPKFRQAFVNDVELKFSGNTARFSVAPDTDYDLKWVVQGFVGTKWSYTLSAEDEGFAVDPANLSNPGKKFELNAPKETKHQAFRVKESEGEEE